MNSVIQEWYKSNKNTKIQELIMRVTNYAWVEMTLFEQGTLREEAAQEFTEMTAELLKLRGELDGFYKIMPCGHAGRYKMDDGECAICVLDATQLTIMNLVNKDVEEEDLYLLRIADSRFESDENDNAD